MGAVSGWPFAVFGEDECRKIIIVFSLYRPVIFLTRGAVYAMIWLLCGKAAKGGVKMYVYMETYMYLCTCTGRLCAFLARPGCDR